MSKKEVQEQQVTNEIKKSTKPESGYDKTDSLATRLAKIGKEIGVIKKEGRNQQQKYDFIKYAAVGGKIREVFEKYHVIVFPEVEDYSMDEIENSHGNKGYHYVLKMKFLVVNGDDKEDKIERRWLSEAADYGDKGINKAETAGTKYFLMRLFNITEIGEKEADETTPDMVKHGSKAQLKLSQQQTAWLTQMYQKIDGMTHSAAMSKVMGLTIAEAKSEATRLKEADSVNQESVNQDLDVLANSNIIEEMKKNGEI